MHNAYAGFGNLVTKSVELSNKGGAGSPSLCISFECLEKPAIVVRCDFSGIGKEGIVLP
jgi:hypothetical protein